MGNELLTSFRKALMPWLLLMPPDIDADGLEDFAGVNLAKTPDILSWKDIAETKLECEILEFVGRGCDSRSQSHKLRQQAQPRHDNRMMQCHFVLQTGTVK